MKTFAVVTNEAVQAIRLFLRGHHPERAACIRIDIQSTGCCDASLGLSLDQVRDLDWVQEVDGLTLVIRPEVSQLTGAIHIACAPEENRAGFVITSEKPLNEWQGFGVCSIRT
jgi:Fe-S cluster assembly iron-binding protein IscA